MHLVTYESSMKLQIQQQVHNEVLEPHDDITVPISHCNFKVFYFSPKLQMLVSE